MVGKHHDQGNTKKTGFIWALLPFWRDKIITVMAGKLAVVKYGDGSSKLRVHIFLGLFLYSGEVLSV